MDCPDCNATLKGSGTRYTCSACGSEWEVSFICENCYNPPEMSSSCGSVSFFCSTCKKAKSREAMEKSFTRL